MIEYMSILEILTQCNYTQGKSKTCIKNIKELMEKYGYDKEDINNITEDFCQGFGIARDIIGEMVRERLWN